MSELIDKEHEEMLARIGAYAQKLGLRAWVVGGAVRDFYLHRPTQDIDLTFDGNQESVAGFCVKQWGGEKHKFSRFGTFNAALKNGIKLDLARLRGETYPFAGVLPVVHFTPNIKEDLFRRDFTINAWALSVLPESFGKSADPYGARKDIDKGFIRVLHDKSFLDDPTRMFRAVRFAGRFGYRLAPKTAQLLREAVKEEYPLLISRERFSRELVKILQEPNVREIFALMQEYDLLKFAYPGMAWQECLRMADDTDMRLGLLVLSLGESGANFLQSLRVDKHISQNILGAWHVWQDAQSPLHRLSEWQKKLIYTFSPSLPHLALDTCFVSGQDLRDLGVCGRHIADILKQVRSAQWNGKITTREEALKVVSRAL